MDGNSYNLENVKSLLTKCNFLLHEVESDGEDKDESTTSMTSKNSKKSGPPVES